MVLYLTWFEYTRLAKAMCRAPRILGPSLERSERLVALPPNFIPRFEAAQDPSDLSP